MSAAPPRAGVVAQSAVYALSLVAVKAIAFLLIPVLTHYLSPPDFGAWGVCAAVSNFLVLVFLFGLYVPSGKLYFSETTPEGRRAVYGTLFLFQVLGGASLAGILSVAVLHVPALAALASPSLLLVVIWTAYLTALNLLPLALMRVREQVTRHGLVNAAASVLGAAGPLAALALGHRTVQGVLVGSLVAGAIMAVVYLLLLLPDIRFELSLARLLPVLAWSLQFIPTSVANWTLNLSDRLVLQRYVALDRVGVYTAGYLVASTLTLVIEGASNSWYTFYLRNEVEKRDTPRVVGAATMFVAGIAFIGVGVALAGPLVVRIALPAAYADAAPVSTIAALAFVLQAPYLVFTFAVMSEQRVTALPLLTIACAAVNVALNVVLVPRVGILAAAGTTVVGYALQMLANGWLAARHHPIAHDYRRWAVALGLTVLLGGGSVLVPRGSLGVEMAWRTVAIASWPTLLLLGGFFTPAERAEVSRLLSARRGRC